MDRKKKNGSFFGILNRATTEPMAIVLAEDGCCYMHKLRIDLKAASIQCQTICGTLSLRGFIRVAQDLGKYITGKKTKIHGQDAWMNEL
jgi:hypothetical protein